LNFCGLKTHHSRAKTARQCHIYKGQRNEINFLARAQKHTAPTAPGPIFLLKNSARKIVHPLSLLSFYDLQKYIIKAIRTCQQPVPRKPDGKSHIDFTRFFAIIKVCRF